jgi:hypothetical protein
LCRAPAHDVLRGLPRDAVVFAVEPFAVVVDLLRAPPAARPAIFDGAFAFLLRAAVFFAGARFVPPVAGRFVVAMSNDTRASD